MYTRIILFFFLTLGVNAQTLHWVTNVQGNVSAGPAFTLTGPVGSYRITYTVLDTLSPYVPVPMDDGSTFRLEIRDIHSFRIYNLTNTLGTDISPANGEIRHVIPSLGAGTYDVRGIATPANGNTNLNWRYTWHTLTVTSAVAQASVINITNLNEITLGSVTVGVEIAEGAVVVDSSVNLTNNIDITNNNQVDASIGEGAFSGSVFNITYSPFEIGLDGAIVGDGLNGERTLRPSVDAVADLGTSTQQWRNGYFAEVLVDNISLPPIPRAGASAEKVTLIFDGATTQYFWGGIGFPVPTFEGTNIYTYTNLYAEGNPLLHIAASTQMAVHAWGAGGGGGQNTVGGAGGYVFAILSTVPGTVYEVIVGINGARSTFANTIPLGGAPGGGDGYLGIGTLATGAGGGYSGVRINETTNFIVVAGAGSGGANAMLGRNGGGRIGQDGQASGSNVVAGAGATADNFYGLNAVAGTNTTAFGSGGFLQGGRAQTNAFGSGISGNLGGGGAGWFGGAAGGITAATGNGQASGGGGISYANPAYVTFAYSVRSPTIGTAPVTDLPIYVTGRANGINNAVGQPGLVVIIE